MKNMILILIAAFIIGGFLGYLNVLIETKWMRKRKDENYEIKNPVYRIIVFAAIATLLTYLLDDYVKITYILLMFFLCYLIAMLDWKSLIIPNKLLLVMLIAGLVFVLTGWQPVKPLNAFLGFGLGLLILAVPYFCGVPIGGGDVKFLAVVGFCTGFMGVLYIMVAVGIMMFLYTVVKAIIHKTHYMLYFKDMLPMGPFISIAFIVFTVFQNMI